MTAAYIQDAVTGELAARPSGYGAMVLFIGLLLLGIYLLRGKGERPKPQPVQLAAPQYVQPAQPAQQTQAESTETVMRIIVDESDEPVDVRIRKLSNLRFERLITDEEFKAAKNKILGING